MTVSIFQSQSKIHPPNHICMLKLGREFYELIYILKLADYSCVMDCELVMNSWLSKNLKPKQTSKQSRYKKFV